MYKRELFDVFLLSNDEFKEHERLSLHLPFFGHIGPIIDEGHQINYGARKSVIDKLDGYFKGVGLGGGAFIRY